MSGACPGPGSGAGGWRGDRSGPALTQPRELDAVSVGEARALRGPAKEGATDAAAGTEIPSRPGPAEALLPFSPGDSRDSLRSLPAKGAGPSAATGCPRNPLPETRPESVPAILSTPRGPRRDSPAQLLPSAGRDHPGRSGLRREDGALERRGCSSELQAALAFVVLPDTSF
ncbi:hypothetical protein R6Z07F_008499 [Ovis aries]